MAEPTTKKKTPASKGAEPVSPPAALPLREAPADPLGAEKDIVHVGHVGPGETLSAMATGDGSGAPLPDANLARVGEPSTPLSVAEAPNAGALATSAQASLDAASPREQAILKAMGATVAPDAKPALVHLPAPPDPNAKRTYRVWTHGDLLRDGKTYRPGDTLDLTADVAEGIGACVELVSE